MPRTNEISRNTGDRIASLYNCGPSPMAAYRTGAVGLEWNVYPRRVINALLNHDDTVGDGKPLCPPQPQEPLHPAYVEAAANTALTLLDALASSGALLRPQRGLRRAAPRRGGELAAPKRRTRRAGDAAIGRLYELGTLARERGVLAPLHAVVSWEVREPLDLLYNPNNQPDLCPWLSDGPEARTRALVLSLLILAHASPPVVLFTRAPSLSLFRMAGLLKICWLGARAAA